MCETESNRKETRGQFICWEFAMIKCKHYKPKFECQNDDCINYNPAISYNCGLYQHSGENVRNDIVEYLKSEGQECLK
jgi:hypothetical protein